MSQIGIEDICKFPVKVLIQGILILEIKDFFDKIIITFFMSYYLLTSK